MSTVSFLTESSTLSSVNLTESVDDVIAGNESATLDKDDLEFNSRHLINILAYSVMFCIGTVGNLVIFVAAYKQHMSPENQHGRRNNVHIMVVHLTIADLIVSFVVMPLEIGWRISGQWLAGNAMCKLLMFIRAFGFYLSSMTLVCLSLDRYLAIAQPMASFKVNKTRRRGRIMILMAWLTSSIFALPQSFVFRVLKHPQIDFLQCTSMNFFTEHMTIKVSLDNGTLINETRTFMGLDPEQVEKMYSCLFLVVVYMFPLLVIIITYANIVLKIVRKKREDSAEQTANSSESRQNGCFFQLHKFSPGKQGKANRRGNQEGQERPHNHHRRRCTPVPGSLAAGMAPLRRPTGKNVAENPDSLNVDPDRISISGVSAGGGGGTGGNGGSPLDRSRSNRSMKFARSQTVALRMSIIHVLTFISCWTPFLVISMWHVIDAHSANEVVSPTLQDVLFLTAVFNSCLNPVVYGGFYFKTMRRSSRGGPTTTTMTSGNPTTVRFVSKSSGLRHAQDV